MVQSNFMAELEKYTLDELELIYETQKDLYSAEEMDLILQRIDALKAEEKKKLDAWIEEKLPKEIRCPKCDGPNSFSNDCCDFCGHKFNKSKYYDPEYYTSGDEIASEDVQEQGRSYTFHCVISFLIPLIGFILGAIMLGKDDEEEVSVGKMCIILGIASIVISAIAWALFFAS